MSAYPTWIRDLPVAHWKYKDISNDPILNGRHPRFETGFIEFGRFPLGCRHTLKTTIKKHFPLYNLARLHQKRTLLEGVGIYRWQLSDSLRNTSDRGRHIQSCFSTASFVKPNGTGVTNIIGRAEVTAITASFLHSHSLIATAASCLSTKPGLNLCLIVLFVFYLSCCPK